jgi:transcriptional regulator with XRE-family HTH domain
MPLQSKEDLIADLQSKKFRDAFVSSRVSNTLALQIRAMRDERGWSQAHLAKLLGTSQNAVYRLESPQYGRYNITTLKRLASIFDVGLAVWFVPFSKLVDRVTHLSTEDILVPSFEDDPGFHERVTPAAGPDPISLSLRVTYGTARPYQQAIRPVIPPPPGDPFIPKLPSFGVDFPAPSLVMIRDEVLDLWRLTYQPLQRAS